MLRSSVACVRSGIASYDFHNELESCEPSLQFDRIPDSVEKLLSHLSKGVDPSRLDSAQLTVLTALDESNMLCNALAPSFLGTAVERQVQFFSEFTPDPCSAQRNLSLAHVMIVGCGGTGNIFVQHLVASGVSRYTLVDGDDVALDNFNRQLCFQLTDVGRPKVSALGDYIQSHTPSCIVDQHNRFVNDVRTVSELIRPGEVPNMIICCADTPPILIESIICKCAIEHSMTALFGGVGVHSAVLGPLLSTQVGLESYLMANSADLTNPIGSDLHPTRASFGVTNTISGALLAKSAIEFLAGISTSSLHNRQLLLTFSDFHTTTLWQFPSPDTVVQ